MECVMLSWEALSVLNVYLLPCMLKAVCIATLFVLFTRSPLRGLAKTCVFVVV